MLLVVRHADAGDTRSWTGPDRLRPLSPTGRRQAEGLLIRLEDYPIDRILSSPTLRSQQTVQPLADDRFLEVEPLAALGMDAGPTQLRALFWDRRLHNVVLCTHGEVIGRLLAELVAEGLVAEDPLDWAKGSTWLVQRTDRGQVYGRLLAPLALEGLQLAGPEAVPVNDQLLRMVKDCPPAQHLIVTMATTGLVDLTLALGAAKVRPPAATSSRCRRQPRTASQARATDGLGGGVAAGAATGEPGTSATPGRRAALAAFTATASAQSRWPTAWRARSTERGGCS